MTTYLSSLVRDKDLHALFAAWLLILCITLAPTAYLLYRGGGPVAFPPEAVDDTYYYLTRLDAVAEGYPFIGNPYIAEHASDPAIAFFAADWIAAVPLLLGAPLGAVMPLNAVVWTLALALALLYLARTLGMSRRRYLVLAAALAFLTLPMLIRPVAMQIITPFFVAFIASMAAWLRAPHSRRATVAFICLAAAPFYLYTYFWQVVAVAVALAHVPLVRRGHIAALVRADIALGVLVAPIILYTAHQLSLPYYWETVARIGFVETHTFGFSGVIAAALALLPLCGLWLIRSRVESLWLIIGGAVWIAAWSNVLTGKDLETAVHVLRFTSVFAIIASAYGVWVAWDMRAQTFRAMFGVALLVGVLGYHAFDLRHYVPALQQDPHMYDQYVPPLAWLSEHAPPGSVVLAPFDLARFIPLATPHFVVYHPNAMLFLMADREAEDRYLVARVFDEVDTETLIRDFRAYAGAGNAIHTYKTRDREATLCRLLGGTSCPPLLGSALAARGEAYFADLQARSERFSTSPSDALERFGVAYVVLPVTHDMPRAVPGLSLAGAAGTWRIWIFSPVD